MDKALRQSQRDDDPLRRGVLLRRAGRVDEALDQFEAVWRDGEPRGGELALELILSRSESEHIRHAERLDRFARLGLEEARTLLDALFPAATNIVGGSEAMQGLRSFIYRQASTDQHVIFWGEAGVGHATAARTLHALSGRGAFHEGYGAAGSQARFRREIEEHPPAGGTLYVSYATDDQDWEEFVLDVCERRDLRLIVGAVAQVEPRVLLRGRNPAVQRIAPLRERFEDLRDLVGALLERVDAGEAVERVTDEEVRRLTWHDWPGNVRELANNLIRAKAASHSNAEIMTQLFQGLFGLPGEVAKSMA